MFGISITEFLIIIFFTILLVKPQEYSQLLSQIKKFYKIIRNAYQTGIDELDKLKKEANILQIDEDFKKDVAIAEQELKTIMGDDGKEYPAYDVFEVMTDINEDNGKKE